MEYQIDAIDRRIIQKLQDNCKSTIKDIAASLNMTTTPVFDRIKRLESEGYILGYTAIVDKNKLGFGLISFASVTLRTHSKENIHSFELDIKKLPEVMECYHIAGMFDYLLKIFSKDMADYQYFITNKLASIANIGKVQSSFIMTEVKNEKVLPC